MQTVQIANIAITILPAHFPNPFLSLLFSVSKIQSFYKTYKLNENIRFVIINIFVAYFLPFDGYICYFCTAKRFGNGYSFCI